MAPDADFVGQAVAHQRRPAVPFGTPDAVVCRAARSASAALAAVGESVGIAERAGGAMSTLFIPAPSWCTLVHFGALGKNASASQETPHAKVKESPCRRREMSL